MNNGNSRKQNNVMDMTEGNITKQLMLFSVPMLLGNLFQQIYNLVDSIVVGRVVGPNALAAIGATGSVTFLFIALCNGMGSGGGIVVSQKFGAKDETGVRKSLTNAAYLMMGMAVIVCVISYLLTPTILTLLKTPSDIISDAISYMRMMCLGLPLVAIYNYSSFMLRALGDSRGPLYFLIVSCLINVVLDILFVKVLGMSVFGAALATVISQFIAGAGCIIYSVKTNEFFRLSKEDYNTDKKIVYDTVRLGVPMSLQFSMIAISCMGLQAVVNSFGSVAVAAFTATSRIEQLVHQPYTSLGTALATFTGQNYGARQDSRIKEGFKKSTIIMLTMSVILLIIMQIGGKAIVSLFVSDSAVIEMGAKGLKITSLFYAVLGMIYVTRGTQNGLGDALFAFINGIVEVIARIILPAFLVAIPALNVYGIWWSAGLVWFVSAVFCLMRYISFNKKHPME